MKNKSPNILFFFLDDLGWRDLACTGSTFYETPNLDRLCLQGMRFENAYAACPVCSPSRASYMTGQYPARVGITDWIDTGSFHPQYGRVVEAPYLRRLPRSHISVAQALKEGGYSTFHVGKWHLGGEDHLPGQFGYDVNIGGCDWGHPKNGYFSPYGIPGLPEGPKGEYLTDRLTDEAIRLVRGAGENPFFLSFCHYAVHTPIQAKEEDIARFREKAARLGLDARDPIVEGERMPVPLGTEKRVRRRVEQSDPAYAAMMWNLDQNIGRLLDALAECGKAEDTVVVFTSDNGGLATAEGSPTCNLPASEGKGWLYEGGLRVPLLIAYPRLIAPGAVCDAPVTTPDFYPTLLELAGLPLRPEQHIDGKSLLPLLRGDALPERPLFWHYPHYGNQGGTPGASVLWGDFKLILFFETGVARLYNLRDDFGEKADIAAQRPDVAARLRAELERWLLDVGAKFPTPNPEIKV